MNQFGKYPIRNHQCQEALTLPEMVDKLQREAATMNPKELEQLLNNISAAVQAQTSLAIQNGNYGQPMK